MRATRGAVRYEELDPLDLKGKAEPVPAWEARARHGHAQRAPAVARPGVAARGPRQRARHARDPLRAGGARGRAPPGEPGGRGRAWASPASCASSSTCSASTRSRPPFRTGPLPPVRHRHRVLGPRRGAARRVRDRGHDSADEAWRKLSSYVADLFGDEAEPLNEPGEREAALIGRLLGIEVPPELVPSERDPERLRESFFSALCARAWRGSRAPAAAGHRLRGHPLGRRRHARRDRAPGAVGARAAHARLPRARRAARPASRLGGGRRSATQLLLDPLAAEDTAGSWPR